MAAVVKQVRVVRNALIAWGLSVAVLWLLRARLWEHREALVLGLTAGVAAGIWHWQRLSRKIARHDRRYARNKIFVNYLNLMEVLIATVVYNPYLSIPLGLLLLAGLLFTTRSAHWWTVLAGGVGLAATGVLTGCVLRYEQRHGPLYYQYKSESWAGAEGLLYQIGTVRKPLTPAGKVTIQGVLWNAVSISGDGIDMGASVEVISVDRLTLYVDRLPAASTPCQGDV